MATVNLSEDRQDRFLGAAINCFARYGYRRTSMGAIADAADVSRPALYQYFTSKEDVFRAAVGWQLSKLSDRVRAETQRPGETVERLLAVLTPVVHMHRSGGGGPGTSGSPLYGEMLDETYARAGDLWDGFERNLLASLGQILERDAGTIRFEPDGPTVQDVAVILFYGTKGIAVHTADAGDALTRVGQLIELTVRGLRDG